MLSVCTRFVTLLGGGLGSDKQLMALSPACNSQLSVAISFGGPAWPISLTDLNLGPVSGGLCLGAIFDITAGSNVKPTPGTPQWIVGDTFLVRIFLLWSFRHPDWRVFFQPDIEKCVHGLPLQPARSGLCTTLKRLLRFATFLLPLCYIYTWVGTCVMGCSYVPLHVFLPAADRSSLSIQVMLGMLTHRFAI
jgi:hypothetical protein